MQGYGEGNVNEEMDIMDLYTEFINILKIEVESEGVTREIDIKKLFTKFTRFINVIQEEIKKSGMAGEMDSSN